MTCLDKIIKEINKLKGPTLIIRLAEGSPLPHNDALLGNICVVDKGAGIVQKDYEYWSKYYDNKKDSFTNEIDNSRLKGFRFYPIQPADQQLSKSIFYFCQKFCGTDIVCMSDIVTCDSFYTAVPNSDLLFGDGDIGFYEAVSKKYPRAMCSDMDAGLLLLSASNNQVRASVCLILALSKTLSINDIEIDEIESKTICACLRALVGY
jgi:hypothetical protein